MARQTGAMITFNDAIYMVNNLGFVAKETIPASNQIMSRAAIEYYLDVQSSYFSTYSSTQAVPYNKVVAIVDTVPKNPQAHLVIDVYASDYIYVNWVAPTGFGTITSYEVYKKVNGGTPQVITVSGSQLDYLDASLIWQSTYEYAIRAKNSTGAYSALSAYTTPIYYYQNPKEHRAGFSFSSAYAACQDFYNTNNPVILWIDGRGFSTGYVDRNANNLYSNAQGTSYVPTTGFYSDAMGWVYWDAGINQVTNRGYTTCM